MTSDSTFLENPTMSIVGLKFVVANWKKGCKMQSWEKRIQDKFEQKTVAKALRFTIKSEYTRWSG